MVLDDISLRHERKNDISKTDLSGVASMLALPSERLAAVVGDLIVFAPLIAVALAPLKLRANQAQLLGDQSAWISLMAEAFFLGALVHILLQTIFIYYLSATPGKLFLGLRVVSIWGQRRPTAMEAFTRSTAWVLELLCLGVPWAAVFGNHWRRPFHDRLAETVVVSLRGHKRAGPAHLVEMSLASGFQSAMLTMLTLLLLPMLYGWFERERVEVEL